MKAQKKWFITGTDTDAGKTVVATALLTACTKGGYTTAALKPVAAGGVLTKDGFFNQDALRLQAAASQKNSYQIDFDIFANGIYQVEITSDNNKVYKKIIITK